MKLIRTIKEMKIASSEYRSSGEKIGFVPTMGALHEGHLSLIDRSKEITDKTILSIFVNPKQFGANEDFKKYPRYLEKDLECAKGRGVDVVFSPTEDEIYTNDFKARIKMSDLSDRLCGNFRPGHFDGVATIVLKLFNITNPDFAFFGEKDFQQCVIIKRMVKELNIDIEIVTIPSIRACDGLALSSRNVYLSVEERKAASLIYQSLKEAQRLVMVERSSEVILKNVSKIIESTPFCNVQYASICTNDTLENVVVVNKKCRLILAVMCGKTRLIDNIELDPNEKTDL